MMLDRVRSWLPGAQKKEAAPKQEVEGGELMEWIAAKKSMTFLDIRDQKTYRLGHVKGAILIPGLELQQRMHELRTDRIIVVLAGTNAKAVRAARVLRSGGLEVVYLKGGIAQWQGKLVK